MKKLAVIIPAAGSGSRMGSSKPKPFLILGEKPILWHTVRAFSEIESVSQIIIPASMDWIDVVEQICASIPNQEIQYKVVMGGSERQFSIQNGLNCLNDNIHLVAVHDAVRPFIENELVIKTCQQALKFGGAIVGVPAKDTIKKVDVGLSIQGTPNRKELWQAQTPQIFKKGLLIKADDASLVERIGGNVKMVEGNRENLKITYPVDLKIAEMILQNEGRV